MLESVDVSHTQVNVHNIQFAKHFNSLDNSSFLTITDCSRASWFSRVQCWPLVVGLKVH